MLYTRRDMKGGYKKTPHWHGFTIIEVMVFLAVSGMTFLIAANFINGKESQAEYYQGMNQALADIRTNINNVSNGNYPLPYNSGLSCAVNTNGPSIQISTTGSSATAGCTLIGEGLAPEVGTNSSDYATFTLAGCQFYDPALNGCSNSINNVPMTVQQEMPQVVTPLTKTDIWPGGVIVTKMFSIINGNWSPIGLVGFFASLPSVNGNVYQSGSQPVSMVVFQQSSLGDSVDQYGQQIDDLGTGQTSYSMLINGYVVVCFQGTNGDIASITIGGNNGGQQITTSLDLGQGVPSQCQ